MDDDLYEILGVSRLATKEEIKKRYKQLAIEFHPDKNPDNVEWTTKKFAEITNAYKILIDDNERKQYDMTGSLPGHRKTRNPYSYNIRTQLDDLYDKFYGPSGVTSNNANEIPSRVNYPPPRMQSCPVHARFASNPHPQNEKTQFGVSSAAPSEVDDEEEESLSSLMGPITVKVYCTLEELQKGTKKVFKVARCREGSLETKNCTVSLYPGIESGAEIVASGQGNKLVNKPAEDIIFKVIEVPHPKFKRVEHDIQETVHITLKQALLGFTLNTLDIDGQTVTKEIHGPIQSGQKEIIPEHGMVVPKSELRGNFIVKFKVDFPNKLTPEQRQAISSFF